MTAAGDTGDATTTATRESALERRSRLLAAGLAIAVVLLLVCAWCLVKGASGGGGASADDIASSVRDNRFQAVYMTNERVYFGRVRAAEGRWVELKDAHFARQRATEGEAEAEDAAPGQEMVSAAAEVGGDGDLLLNADEVVLVQDLASDSDYAEALEDALE